MTISPNGSAAKQAAAGTSVLASGGLLLLKLIAAVVTGSLGLFGEVAHGLIDLGATIVTWFAVRVGDKPADEDHHFGHSKVESVAALAETVLLLVTGLAVAAAAAYRLWNGTHEVSFSWLAVGLIVLTIGVDFNRSRMLEKTAQATGSDALAADALHFRADMWSSGAVLIGLICVALGAPWADSVVALLVAGFIAVSGYRLGVRTIATLVDQAPEGVAEQIRTIADEHAGVLAVTRVRARPSGASIFIELAVQISRLMPLTSVAAMKADLQTAVRKAIPNADVTVSTESIEIDTETVFDKVMVLARHEALAVHHVLVQKVGERLSVSFDLEVDGSMPLIEAHETASRLEQEIRKSLGSDVEVESHIEPLPPEIIHDRDAPGELLASFKDQLLTFARQEPLIQDVHNVRLRQAPNGLYIHYHCRVRPETRVADVHLAIDRLEDKLKASNPELLRVVAHAEPLKV